MALCASDWGMRDARSMRNSSRGQRHGEGWRNRAGSRVGGTGDLVACQGLFSRDSEQTEAGHKLNHGDVVLRVVNLRTSLHGISELHNLIRRGAEPGAEFISLGSSKRDRMTVSDPRSRIPAGMKHAAHFGIARVQIVVGDLPVGHLKAL